MPDEYEVFRAILSDRPIAFHPQLARILGGIHEALFFQQIAYWSGKGADPEWIYKTAEEMREETALNRYQQDKARTSLKKLGVIKEQRRGLPARMYYRVEWARVYELLRTPVCSPSTNLIVESSTQVRPPSTNLSAEGQQTSKSTSETTSEEDQEISNFERPRSFQAAFEDRLRRKNRSSD